MEKLVSVVIPTYNRASLINRAIDSVLAQTYKNIEIIVVDDGSTDNTKEALVTYGNKIKYFYKDNKGESSARNFGILKAQGDYLAFLDSDDLWHQEKIRKQIQKLTENPDFAIAITNLEFIEENGRSSVKNFRTKIIRDGYILPYILRYPGLGTSTVLAKKEVFVKVGLFDENFYTAADQDWMFRACSEFKALLIEEPLVKNILSADSTSKSLFTKNRLRALRKLKQYNPEFYRQNKKLIIETTAQINLDYARDLLWSRYIKESRERILESLCQKFSLEAARLYLKSWLISITAVFLPQYRKKRAELSYPINKKLPLVSAIIPTYNRADLVTQAIDSILDQTYENIEIIVVDDGSTDDTKKILSEYRDKIKYYYKTNGGNSDARNFGINKAAGKYIAFLDHDDLWLPKRIEKMVGFLEDNDKYSAIISEVEFVDRDCKTTGFSNYQKNYPAEGKALPYLLKNLLGLFSNLIIKKEATLKIGELDEGLKAASDIDYFLRIAVNHRIALYDKPLLKYRKIDSSLSNNLFTKNRLRMLDKFQRLYPELSKKYDCIIKCAYAKVHLSYAEDLLWNRYIKEAQGEILASLRNCYSVKAFFLYFKSVIIQLLAVFNPEYRKRKKGLSEK